MQWHASHYCFAYACLQSDVMAAPAGRQRDLLIREWCISGWNAWSKERDQIVTLVKNELGIG
jgi:hypothetical protein